MAKLGFSIGEVSGILKIKGPSITSAVNRDGAPDASIRIGGRRVFTPADVARLRRWYLDRGKRVGDFDERDYLDAPKAPELKPSRRGGVLAGAAM